MSMLLILPSDAGQPGTEIFNMPASTTAGTSERFSPSPTASILSTHAHFCLHCLCPPVGPVSIRCHPAPEAPSNSIGLEAIIRKALMGNYDDQSEERTSNATNPGSVSTGAAVDGRAEEFFSQGALWSLPVLSVLFKKSSKQSCSQTWNLLNRWLVSWILSSISRLLWVEPTSNQTRVHRWCPSLCLHAGIESCGCRFGFWNLGSSSSSEVQSRKVPDARGV